ncbi:hypothetical protein BD289DRAFT_462368 [Coniella lustricola]|uniref:DUF7730 domain-containing protein n=1 Tax=Coniella lustricola TaxID=2025994 RepID=A0A2T3A0X3_9PEZI|nr:hypothetical protein BD289DRAFT_462368 [Coniella lustricola]
MLRRQLAEPGAGLLSRAWRQGQGDRAFAPGIVRAAACLLHQPRHAPLRRNTIKALPAMAPRSAKGSRAKGSGSSPTPIQSAAGAATSSQGELDDAVNEIDIASLTLDVPLQPVMYSRKKIYPFRFMDLPSELRIKVYGYYFADRHGVIDLQPGNYSRLHMKLRILRVCRTVYQEASHVFYSTNVFRIFPIDGRHVKTKRGLLTRIKPQSRRHMTTLELRVGPGWAKPYRSWIVDDTVGLQDCVNVRRLHVYIEIDPSDSTFNGWRKASGFYEKFCRNLLNDILTGLPNVNTVQFDAHSPVRKSADIVQGLLEAARARQCAICWGPERGWTDADDEDDEAIEVLYPISVSWTPAPVNTLVQDVVA